MTSWAAAAMAAVPAPAMFAPGSDSAVIARRRSRTSQRPVGRPAVDHDDLVGRRASGRDRAEERLDVRAARPSRWRPARPSRRGTFPAGSAMMHMMTAERERLQDLEWKRWGPYLAERAWGTVREDYSADGDAWDYLPHDHARSRAYRWSEDGLGGDLRRPPAPLLRASPSGTAATRSSRSGIFGLTGTEGNHGEDAKEYWWYLDSTPTHSWMRWRYLVPAGRVPLRASWSRRTRAAAGTTPSTSCSTPASSTTTATGTSPSTTPRPAATTLHPAPVRNAGPDQATLHVLPTLWFRNTWSWGLDDRRPDARRERRPPRRRAPRRSVA